MNLTVRGRRLALVWSLALCFAVASPVSEATRESTHDSFPLSWYPMFATPRPALEDIVYVIGRGEDGRARKIHTAFWSRGGGFNQARTQLTRAAKAGPRSARAFCEKIAENVALSSREEAAGVVTLEIHRGTFSREAAFREGDLDPVLDRVLVRCPVERR